MSSALAPWLSAQLAELLRQRGHAWLLQGPSGLGQYALGLELARAWLCAQPTPTGACGQCASCHGVDVRAHADLCVLMPETAMLELGWPLAEKAQKDIDDKKRKPSKEIRVEAVRDMVAFTQHTRSGQRAKVVLIYPADRMNAVSANTLLKTLEEPAGDTRFVLASDAAHALLPTVRSRCQTHTLSWPDAASAQSWLTAHDLDPAQAQVLLRAAGGRPENALSLAHMGVKARQWAALPKAVAKGDVAALADWTPAQVVDILQKICHDAQVQLHGSAPRFFASEDLPEARNAWALSQWAKELAQSARSAEHPYHAGLMLEALVGQARRALTARA